MGQKSVWTADTRKLTGIGREKRAWVLLLCNARWTRIVHAPDFISHTKFEHNPSSPATEIVTKLALAGGSKRSGRKSASFLFKNGFTVFASVRKSLKVVL